MRWFVAAAQVEPAHPSYAWGEQPAYQVWVIRARTPESALGLAERRVARYQHGTDPVDVYVYPLALEAERADSEKVYRPDWRIPKVGCALHASHVSAQRPPN